MAAPRFPLFLPALLCLAALPARAADAPLEATVLYVRETAIAAVPPDILTATLRAESRGEIPAKVQQAVNGTVGDALAKARTAADVTATTGSYRVYEAAWPTPPVKGETPEKPLWVATQTLTLSSRMPDKLLDLAGQMQQSGLLLVDVQGEVGRALRHSTQEKLSKDALALLQAQAKAAAEAMGMKIVGYKSIRLEKGADIAPVRPMMRVMAGAAAAPVPSAEPAEQQISVTAEGEVLLRPQ